MPNNPTVASILTAMLLLVCSTARDMSWAQRLASCPGANAARYPFDNTHVQFDSIDQRSAGTGNIIYCVRVEGARHPYLVNWPDVQWYDVATRSDGYLQSNSSETSRRIELDQSDAYVGANQRKFTPKIRKEISQVRELIDTAVTLVTGFFGSIRLKPNKSEESQNFVSVDLKFAASYEDGTGRLEYVNAEKDESRALNFKFSEAIRQRIPELDGTFTLSPNRNSTKYKISGKPMPERVGLTFMNSDFQEVATIPVVIYVPAGQ
jgi:hypothetical protein